jgi:transcriptional regulator with XRE-family HTH domain
MARMASRPRIGALIREGMERQHLDQIQLAEALEVSRSAVNAWINDRAWPLNRIAALEDLLKIKIPRKADPVADIRAMDWLTPAQQDNLIALYEASTSPQNGAQRAG